jgi:hypothetical protein
MSILSVDEGGIQCGCCCSPKQWQPGCFSYSTPTAKKWELLQISPPALHAWPAHAVAMRGRPARCVHGPVRKPVGLAAQW